MVHSVSRGRRRLTIEACTMVLLLAAIGLPKVSAQPPATAIAEPDPGVRPTRLIDRDEIRVSRIDLQPGAVRSLHAHDDVEFHVWAPVSGTLEITIGTEPPRQATSGQAVFMNRGTRHGFRNVGDTPAAVFEIFVKSSTTRAGAGMSDVRGLLAGLVSMAEISSRAGLR